MAYNWLTFSLHPPGSYAWAVERGCLVGHTDELTLKRRFKMPLYSCYSGAAELYEVLRGLPKNSLHYVRTFWLDTSDDPYKLALIGGNLLVYGDPNNEWTDSGDLPLRGATAEETVRAAQAMREIAALDWPVLKEEDHASTIRQYLRAYSHLEPGEEVFFSLV